MVYLYKIRKMNYTTITSFPNYEINEFGQIRNKRNNKILSQSLSSGEYYQVNIDNKSRRIHRLLAETFIPNPNNLETVNHINGNKVDNSLSNLEWISRSDNVKHSREVLGIIPIPYSKSDKIHHLVDKKGKFSNAGKKIKVTYKDNLQETFGSASQAAKELFGNPELGKSIRQAIKRGNNYKHLKFEEYESDN